MTLLLAGDMMIGRGIGQIVRHGRVTLAGVVLSEVERTPETDHK